LGYFGPTEGDPLWIAAQLAIEKANLEGGYRGLPFRLIATWSENPWGSGISQLARSVYTEDLWAIVGSIDGPSTHLVEQLVAKARLTLINPVSSDKTVNLANVPWMFSCLPGEHLQAPVLARDIANSLSGSSLTLVTATDHDSRVLTRELKRQLASAGVILSYQFEIDSQMKSYLDLIDQVLSTRARSVVVIAGPRESAWIVRQLRVEGFSGRVYGGPNMGRTEFLREAGSAALGITFPDLIEPAESEAFGESFQAKSGTPPDFRAFQTYDSVTLLIRAIRMAGLNRARIRDAVRDLSPWQGISGPIIWDALGQNSRPVKLATIGRSQIETFELR
jgi:branched-chain amino acid transport system substrate-binding protein